MRPRNKRESIIMIEGLADVLSKGVPCTTGGYTPPAAVVGGQTRADHTSGLREAPPVRGRCLGRDPTYRWRVKGRRGGRISLVRTKCQILTRE